MHHADPVIAAFVDDMRFFQQKALRDGFSANQWRHSSRPTSELRAQSSELRDQKQYTGVKCVPRTWSDQ